ncbi:MAG: hypothetical protein AMJ65_11985 [Phycisphaerae bacterium SG8_4]|nr:MAG: hypothetical protein AMJ65_11985 [Phycisphaerae bacterium SG8_4]
MTSRCSLLSCLAASCILLLQTGCQQQGKLSEEPSSAPTELTEPLRKSPAPAPNKLSPRITFEKLEHDFGEVSPNSMNTGQIKFTNTGQALLKITEVGRCCGVVAKLDKGKTEYAPGESGAVNIEWRSGSQPSVFKRQLVVHSNDMISPKTYLAIQAKIVRRVTWEPNRLRLFLDKENAGCPKVTITSIDDQPFSITGFKSTGDYVTAGYDPSVKLTKHVIEPKVNAEKLRTNLKGQININTTHPEGSTITILFDVVPEYKVTPPVIIVFNAEPGKTMARKIVLVNNYGRDFEIESVSSKDNTVAIEVLKKTRVSNGYHLEVGVTVPAAAGKAKFTGEFSINLAGGEKLPVKCHVYYPRTAPKSETR